MSDEKQNIASPIEPVVMLPCPFCGSEAVVKCETDKYQIIGCGKLSMLCPNPSMTIYRKNNGKFYYDYWNQRVK